MNPDSRYRWPLIRLVMENSKALDRRACLGIIRNETLLKVSAREPAGCRSRTTGDQLATGPGQ